MGKSKPLLFVDTNIFLDFYRAEGEAGLTLLKHVDTVSASLIITDQVEAEFLANRQRVISVALQSLKSPSIPEFTPAYLSDTKAAAALQKGLKDIRKRISVFKERFARILKNPSLHDPVFRAVTKIVSTKTSLNLKFVETEQSRIFSSALARFQRGFPPRKRQDDNIGDAINWEWILACAKRTLRDVIIVSRDGDYGLASEGKTYANDWLQQEFKDRVSPKRKVTLTQSLAYALKELSVKVTPVEETEEQSIIDLGIQSKPEERPSWQYGGELYVDRFPPFWPELVKRVGAKSPFVRTYFSEISRATLLNGILTMSFDSIHCEHVPLVDNSKNHALVLIALKEMGINDVKALKFTSHVEKSPSSIMALSVDDNVPF